MNAWEGNWRVLVRVALRKNLATWQAPFHPLFDRPSLVSVCSEARDVKKHQIAYGQSNYARLRELQGTIIPICYSLVVCYEQQVPALVLSDIGGCELYQSEACAIPKDRLAKLLRDAFEALARCGVGHGDLKLDNLHLIRDNNLRVMVVDLESVEDIDAANSAFFVDSDIDHILRTYRNHQECPMDDGLLPKQQLDDYTD